MTEAEWLQCADPYSLLKHVRKKLSHRKLRLLGVAYCRRVWHVLTDERSRTAVEAAEMFADGSADERERRAARTAASIRAQDVNVQMLIGSAPSAALVDWYAAEAAEAAARKVAWKSALAAARKAGQAEYRSS